MTRGAGYLLWAISYIFGHRKLFVWSSLTILLNLLVYGGLFALGFWLKDPVSHYVAEHIPFLSSFRFTEAIVETLIFVAWMLVCVFLAIAIASIIAGPMLDILSEETERLLTGHVNPAPFSLILILREGWIIVRLTLRGLVLGVCSALFLGWIPIVGQIIPFAVAAFFVALNFLQPALARHNLKRKERIELTDQNKALIFGFGAPANLIPFLLVPILTPALVVGGTRLYLSLAAEKKAASELSPEQRERFLAR